jgi:hypothetical protein
VENGTRLLRHVEVPATLPMESLLIQDSAFIVRLSTMLQELKMVMTVFANIISFGTLDHRHANAVINYICNMMAITVLDKKNTNKDMAVLDKIKINKIKMTVRFGMMDRMEKIMVESETLEKLVQK